MADDSLIPLSEPLYQKQQPQTQKGVSQDQRQPQQLKKLKITVKSPKRFQ